MATDPLTLSVEVDADVPGERLCGIVEEDLTETEEAVLTALRMARRAEGSWDYYNEREAWALIQQDTYWVIRGFDREKLREGSERDVSPRFYGAALANAEAIAYYKKRRSEDGDTPNAAALGIEEQYAIARQRRDSILARLGALLMEVEGEMAALVDVSHDLFVAEVPNILDALPFHMKPSASATHALALFGCGAFQESGAGDMEEDFGCVSHAAFRIARLYAAMPQGLRRLSLFLELAAIAVHRHKSGDDPAATKGGNPDA